MQVERRAGQRLAVAGLAVGLLTGASGAELPGSLHGRPLPKTGQIEAAALRECSGLVASPTRPGLFWALNDSGDGPRLFALRADGSAWTTAGAGDSGVRLRGARNVDWESLTVDHLGRLVVADLGNNDNRRRDLTVYRTPEPDPGRDREVPIAGRVVIRYPDQTAFPPAQRNFDCEAVFWSDGRLHVLTKHRADDEATLYRLETWPETPSEPVELVRLGRLALGGQVTGAEAHPDGLRLAILTYTTVWVLTRSAPGADWLGAERRRRPYRGWACEAVAWEGDEVLVASENRDLFRLPPTEFAPAGP